MGREVIPEPCLLTYLFCLLTCGCFMNFFSADQGAPKACEPAFQTQLATNGDCTVLADKVIGPPAVCEVSCKLYQHASTPDTQECKFTCASGKCLYLGSLICNQQNDCGDNSDEENCLLVTEHPPPGIFSSELEFVQIIIIIVVITVMVVVIICLLNHYKLSTRSFINRQSQSRRQEETLQTEGCLWPSESSVSRQGASEIMYAPRSRDRFTTPSFMQRDRFSRFQPTYPYMQHEIDLPPTISLSDGEEPPPYQGPCTLQLRDPEQQMELNRESVRAPPNRTIFDSDLIDISMYNGGPCPPSSNSGISATSYSSNGRMEGPPPTYSEVMGHYPGSSFFHHQHNNVPPSSQRGSRLQFQQNNSESTIVPSKGQDRKPGNLV